MKPTSSKKNPIVQWLIICTLLLCSNRVFAQLIADFTCSSVSGCAPVLVNFTDQSAGNPTQWRWELGNGTVSYLQHPSVTYLHPGSYTVKLLVKNGDLKDSVVKLQHITVYAAPAVNFSAPATTGCNELLVNFNGQCATQDVVAWKWDFGDGQLSEVQNPVHQYNQLGAFNVTLQVTNQQGCAAAILKPAFVVVNGVQAAFEAIVGNRCAGNQIQFVNKSTGNGQLTYHWQLGDDAQITSRDVTHRYATGGFYTVKMQLSNQFGCTAAVTKIIKADTPVTAKFNATGSTYSCTAPLDVQLNATPVLGNTYTWWVNDSVFANTANPVLHCTDSGSYLVKLLVKNGVKGCVDSVSKPNFIKINAPLLQVLNLPDSGCYPFTKTMKVQAADTALVQTIYWHFGDGSTAQGWAPVHVYQQPGVYMVTVIVSGSNGCTDTIKVANAVKVTGKPKADFTSDFTKGCAYTNIQFTNLSTGGNSWYWEFNNNDISDELNPMYRFRDTGFVPVQLVVFNGGCADTMRKERWIYLEPAVTKFKTSFTCDNPSSIFFQNFSAGADTWSWSFGDGTSSVAKEPVHQYAAPGEYEVHLEGRNNRTGCYYLKTTRLQVLQSAVTIKASDTVACRGKQLVFETNADLASTNRITWFFGDGTIVNQRSKTIAHTYAAPGTYTVQLIVVNAANCADTITQKQYIRIVGPRARFGTTVAGACVNTPVSFLDSSITDGQHPIVNWKVNFGDGSNGSYPVASFEHAYAKNGDYWPVLVITDALGCQDSVKIAKALPIRKLVSSIITKDSIACTGMPVAFVTPYAEQGVSYRWSFGDGVGAASKQSPVYAYNKPGLYDVKVVVSHAYGCADSTTQAALIRIEDPVALFSMSDSIGTCPPLQIQFTNQSKNAINEHWDFGDGSATTLHNPVHFYSRPGRYHITLTVFGSGGCSSQYKKQVLVNGPAGAMQYDTKSICKPELIHFKVSAVDVVAYTWDFDDGTTIHTADSMVSHLYTNGGVYQPRLMLVDSKGCQVPLVSNDSILFGAVKANFTMQGNKVCDSGLVSFIDSSAYRGIVNNYTWQFGDGTVASGNAVASHMYKQPGTYYPSLRISTLNGCTDSVVAATPVTVQHSPAVSLSYSGNACAPFTASFAANGAAGENAALTWHWDFGNGQSSEQQLPPPQLYSMAGNYQVTLTADGNSGCKKIITQPVTAFTVPHLQASADTLICQGQTVLLKATGANAYQWQSDVSISCANCSTVQSSPANNTWYKVTGISANGCTALDSVLVKVKTAFKLKVSPATKLCAGSSTRLSASNAAVYQWYPATGLNDISAAAPTANPAVNTVYTVIGKDEMGCFADTAKVQVSILSNPFVDAGKDQTIAPGTPTDLIPQLSADVVQVNWWPTHEVFRNNGAAITVKPIRTTQYRVEVKNALGCTATDTVLLKVTTAAAGNLFVPNTFSPNGDGNNDLFYPRSGGALAVKALQVFNRLGKMVYQRKDFVTNQATGAWDGMVNGVTAEAGIYWYVLSYTTADGRLETIKGDIALIK
jgi:gliding motility-associated-like protein